MQRIIFKMNPQTKTSASGKTSSFRNNASENGFQTNKNILTGEKP